MKKIKNCFDLFFVSSCKWLYNHCSLFRNFLKKQALKQGEINLVLLELFMSKEPIDVDYWCDRISKAK